MSWSSTCRMLCCRRSWLTLFRRGHSFFILFLSLSLHKEHSFWDHRQFHLQAIPLADLASSRPLVFNCLLRCQEIYSEVKYLHAHHIGPAAPFSKFCIVRISSALALALALAFYSQVTVISPWKTCCSEETRSGAQNLDSEYIESMAKQWKSITSMDIYGLMPKSSKSRSIQAWGFRQCRSESGSHWNRHTAVASNMHLLVDPSSSDPPYACTIWPQRHFQARFLWCL